MRDLVQRAAEASVESGDHIPVPLVHRGPDTVDIVPVPGGLEMFDEQNPDAWLSYQGCYAEAIN